MKKSLVALAVAGVFAAPVAFADVTLSGAINVGPMLTSTGDGSSSVAANSPFNPGRPNPNSTNGKGFSQSNLANNYSNFNISSTDDIGGGNSVVLNIQTAIGLGDTGSAFGNRNSYLGVKGGWGGLYWGTNENIYEQYMYESDPLDGAVGLGGNLSLLGTPGAGTVFDVGQSTNGAGFYRRTDNGIWYASPSFGGFTFGGTYTLNAHKTASGSATPRVISLGAQFKPDGGPFFVNAAYEQHNDLCGLNVIVAGNGSTSCKDTGLQFGGGVTFGDFSLFARYEMLTYKGDNGLGTTLNKYERDAVWVGAKFALPTGYIGAEIGRAMEANCDRTNAAACSGDGTGATLFGIGYFHNLSKQSQVQIIASGISNGDAANYVFAGGPAHDNNVNGANHKGVFASIKHVF
jgi:predicted porin